jgi:hypothetical protein
MHVLLLFGSEPSRNFDAMPAAAAAVVQQRAIMPSTGRTEERARTGTELVTALIGAAVTLLTGAA